MVKSLISRKDYTNIDINTKNEIFNNPELIFNYFNIDYSNFFLEISNYDSNHNSNQIYEVYNNIKFFYHFVDYSTNEPNKNLIFLLYNFNKNIGEEEIKYCFPSIENITDMDFYSLLDYSDCEYSKKKNSYVLKYFFRNIEKFDFRKRIFILKYFFSITLKLFSVSTGFITQPSPSHLEILAIFKDFFNDNLFSYIVFILLSCNDNNFGHSFVFLENILSVFNFDLVKNNIELIENNIKVEKIMKEFLMISEKHKYDCFNDKFLYIQDEEMIKMIKNIFKTNNYNSN